MIRPAEHIAVEDVPQLVLGADEASDDENLDADMVAQAVDVGINMCASEFVTGLLDFAIDDYSDEVVRKTLNVTVLPETESATREAAKELMSSVQDESLVTFDMFLPTKSVESDADLDEAVSVVSCDSQAPNENHAMAERMASEIVENSNASLARRSMPSVDTEFAAIELTEKTQEDPQLAAQPLELPCAAQLAPCTRPTFRRRLAPQPPSPGDEPFPMDCLPCSAPVARELPPSAEVAGLRMAKSQAPRFTMGPPIMPASISPRLSSEAEGLLLTSAAEGLDGLYALALEEAAGIIQRHWRCMYANMRAAGEQASLISLSMPVAACMPAVEKSAIALAVPAPPPAGAPLRPGGDPRRRMAGAHPTASASPTAVEWPSAAPAAPEDPSGQIPDAPQTPRMNRSSTAALAPASPETAVTPVAPVSLDAPRPPSATRGHAPSASSAPQHSRIGTSKVPASPRGEGAATQVAPSRPTTKPSSVSGGRRPHLSSKDSSGVQKRQEVSAVGGVAQAIADSFMTSDASMMSVVSPPPRASTPRSAASASAGGSSGDFATALGPRAHRPPMTPRTPATPTAAGAQPGTQAPSPPPGPSAMELDLGLAAGTLRGSSLTPRPTTPGRLQKTSAFSASPRCSVGSSKTGDATGLLPLLHSKVSKSGDAAWSVTAGRLASPQMPVTRSIDGTGAGPVF